MYFFKQKTAYEMRISVWSSDVCSSDRRSKDGKMRGNAMEVLDEATKELFQGMVDEVDEVFVDAVERFRGISKKAVHETNASVYMGRQALATGLCNEILSEPEDWMKIERKIARK